jgi:hypothetical protein
MNIDASNSVTIFVTTDGTRPGQLARLLQSISEVEDALLVLALQNGATDPTLPTSFKPKACILRFRDKLPLSIARNRMLDEVEYCAELHAHTSRGHVFFADDDCWYAPGFFESLNLDQDINFFATLDPSNGKRFTEFAPSSRRRRRTIAPWEVMFYSVSFTIAIPFKYCRELRFHPEFGLGAKIPQGEESLFIFEVCRLNPEARLSLRPDRLVYHPWKKATDARNHRALAYFMGWCLRQRFWQVLPFFGYLVAKGVAVLAIRRKPLYWKILSSLLQGFVMGVRNTDAATDLRN